MIRHTKQFYEFGPFRVDPGQRQLLRDGEVVTLTPKVFDTLLTLVENSGRILTKDEVMKQVWPDHIVEEANLTTNISVLRRALGNSSDKSQYIETIPWRGYRFVADVREVRNEFSELIVEERSRSRIVIEEQASAPASATESNRLAAEESEATHSETRSEVRRKLKPLALASGTALILVAAAIFYFWIVNRPNEALTGATIKSIAVLPFQSLSPDAGDQYLSLGMADTVIIRLSNIKQLIVRPTSAVRKYANDARDPIAAGREQQVDAVLDGSIHSSGGKIRVTARLVNVRDGSALWVGSFDEKEEDLFKLQDSIVARLAGALTPKISGEEQKLLTRRYTENAQAHQLYLRGRYHWDKWTPREIRKSIEYFEQAISIDPNYALAYTGLADAYSTLNGLGVVAPREIMPKAKAAAARALELDDTLAEAHTTMGLIKHFYDWDFEGGDKEFERAIALSPNSATAYHLYGKCLPDTLRFDEALAAFKKALELDPYSVGINKDYGETLFYARDFDLAIEQWQKTLQLEPNYSVAYFWLSKGYEAQGLYDLAFDAYLKMLAPYGTSSEGIRTRREIYAKSGWKGFWQKQVEDIKRRAPQGYVEPYYRVWLYLRIGEKQQALDWLEKAFEARSTWICTIKYDPLLDSLRTEPRFQAMVRSIGPST